MYGLQIRFVICTTVMMTTVLHGFDVEPTNRKFDLHLPSLIDASTAIKMICMHDRRWTSEIAYATQIEQGR